MDSRERPINLRAHEVRAILEGRQTQLRRVVKPQPEPEREMKARRNRAGNTVWMNWRGKPEDANPETGIYGAGWDQWRCPYGQPGDRLWVRETMHSDGDMWWFPSTEAGGDFSFPKGLDGEYTGQVEAWIEKQDKDGRVTVPNIHMPRWASRILLEVVSVRVERLQEVRVFDFGAEGAPSESTVENVGWFKQTWGQDWVANRWTWVVEFRKVEQ